MKFWFLGLEKWSNGYKHLLLIQKIQILFPEPLSGGSQLSVILAPRNIAPPSRFYRHCMQASGHTHVYTKRENIVFKDREYRFSSVVMKLRSEVVQTKYMSYSIKMYNYIIIYIYICTCVYILIFMYMCVYIEKEVWSFHINVNRICMFYHWTAWSVHTILWVSVTHVVIV